MNIFFSILCQVHTAVKEYIDKLQSLLALARKSSAVPQPSLAAKTHWESRPLEVPPCGGCHSAGTLDLAVTWGAFLPFPYGDETQEKLPVPEGTARANGRSGS